MANFKLGANAITAAYLGTQGICIINDGANTVFDAACGAQFTVTHNVSGSPGGTTNGYTISTSPGTTFTGEPGDAYSFTTTVSLNSGYRWQGGTTPTISPSQPITGVVGSADSTVTTTISGGTVELIPVGVVTASVSVDTSSISGPSAGYTIVGSQSPQSGDSSSVNYSFSLSASLVAGYEWTGGAPTNATASGTLYSSGTVTAQFGGATVQLIQYVATQYLANNVHGPDAGYFLLWDGISNYNATSGSRQITGTYGQLKSFPESTLSVNSPTYTETSALTIVGGGQQYTTFGNAAWGGSTTRSFYTTTSGTVALTPTNVTMTLTVDTSGVSGTQYTLTGDQTSAFRTGSSPSQYTFTTNLIPNSGYQFTGSATKTTTATYPASSAGVTLAFSGAVQLIINDSEIIGTAEVSGSFTNSTAACNAAAAGTNSVTIYYAGGSSGDPVSERLYLGSGLTSEIVTGWFYNTDQGLPFYYSNGYGISYYDSC